MSPPQPSEGIKQCLTIECVQFIGYAESGYRD